MDMSSSSSTANACKISMLWNWYTIDSCFIARSWHNTSHSMFIGSCVGCAFLVISAQWLHRVGREYDAALIRRRRLRVMSGHSSSNTSSLTETSIEPSSKGYIVDSVLPILDVLSHSWYGNILRKNQDSSLVYPTLFDHLCRTLIFTAQWTLSYIIMLLFMYYNGWIIISCIIGAFIGRLLFNYEALGNVNGQLGYDKEENDRKCCM